MTSFETTQGEPQSISHLLGQLRNGELQTLGVGPAGTGFEPLDSVLDGGFLPGEVILLGGQPGAGKTICSLQWARNIAANGRRVTFACFEHDETALLNRLLIQELAIIGADADPNDRIRARAVVRDLMLGVVDLQTAVGVSPLIWQALTAMDEFSPNLTLLRASTQLTTPHELDLISGQHLDTGGVLFVDYLQKLPIRSAQTVSERVYQAIEILKELAIGHHISVVAVSAAADKGIGAGRIRLEHLRGSDALAHECDVAILLNQKLTATSDRHLKYDLTQLDEARRRTIFSIEKNRRGEIDVHLDFVKDFANFRFVPSGTFVSETLTDE